MATANPDLDSISDFVVQTGGLVASSISLTAIRAPSYITGSANTYTVGSKVYITGAETPANNGSFEITEFTTVGYQVGFGKITYRNSAGVTQASQFALCTPFDVSMVKGLTSPLTIIAAKPFSYSFTSPAPWNPPPVYNYTTQPVIYATGALPVVSTTSGTTTHLVTSITSTAAYSPNVSFAKITYPMHDLNNLYPYNFSPSITLPIVNGTLYDDGNNYLTCDGDGTTSRFYSRCNIFTAYSVGSPTGIVYDSANGVIYVADTNQYVIRKIIVATKVESIIAGGARFLDPIDGTITVLDGFGTSSIINTPIGLALDQTRQLLYVSEGDTGSIRKINLVTLEVTTELQGALDYSSQSTAWGIAVNPFTNTLYIANNRVGYDEITIMSRDLTTHINTDLVTVAGGVSALALDIPNNKLYYAGGQSGAVVVLNLGSMTQSTLWVGSGPYGLALDPVAGILYVSDYYYNNIYQLTLSPFTVSVVAGNDYPGNADGVGTAASFNQPYGLAIDLANHILYVADNGNTSIRRISLYPGVITYGVTTAIGYPGSFSGASSSGLAIDNANSLIYIPCLATNFIYKYNLATGVTTVLTSACSQPLAGVLNSAGSHLYVTSSDGLIYDVTTSSGAVVTLAGSPGSVTELDSVGLQPYSGAVGTSNAWNVSGCSSNGTNLAVGSGGTIYVSSNSGSTWAAGTGLPGSGTWGGLGVDAGGYLMYAAIYNGNVYKSINRGASWAQDTVINGGTAGSWVAVETAAANSLYILDNGISSASNPTVWRTTDAGATWNSTTLEILSASGIACAGSQVIVTQSATPDGVVAISTDSGVTWSYITAVSGKDFHACAAGGSGTYLIAEASGYIYSTINGGTTWTRETNAGSRVWTKIAYTGAGGTAIATSTTGVFRSTVFGSWVNITAADRPGTSWSSVFASPYGSGTILTATASTNQVYNVQTGQSPLFYNPQFIARDSTNSYLYITCGPGHTLRCFDLTFNTVSTVAYGLTGPTGVVIDSTNTYAYVADGNRIIKITLASGVTTVIAGSATAGETDGIGTAATFEFPIGIALDSAHGVLYVADLNGSRIRKITLSTAAVVTIAGSGAQTEVDGIGTSASFNGPFGLVINSTLTALYVTDYGGGNLRVVDITPKAVVTTDVVGTIPSGYNAITLSGTTYLYNSPPTIRCDPENDALSYTLKYNGTGGLPVVSIGETTEYNKAVQFIVTYAGVTSTPTMTFNYYGPTQITYANHPSSETPLIRNSFASTALVPFIGPTGSNVAISSTTGFTFVSAFPLTYVFELFSPATGDIFETYSNTITPTAIPILSTPTFSVPFSTYTYVPISYVFSLPDDVVDVTLDPTGSSTNLSTYLTTSGGNTLVNFYSATGSVTPMSGTLGIYAYITDVPTPVGQLISPVNILISSIIVTPPVESGVPINLYKYEAFSYVFTLTGVGTPLVLKYDRSSAQLAPYATLSLDGSTITFAGTPPASYSSTLLLVIDLMSGTTIVNSLTYPVTISAGRIIVTPASPLVFYQFERTSNTFGVEPVFATPPLSSVTFNSLFATPTLPTGLSFSATNTVTGKPFLKQTPRNYEVYGSNSTTGDITTASISIEVKAPVVRIRPSADSFSNLTRTSTPTATFTSLLPETNSYVGSNNFGYLWSYLPSGLIFTDIDGTPLPNGYIFHPADGRFTNTIKLAGTPTLTDITTFPSSGLVTTVLTGDYLDASAKATGTATLSFQFAETVGMTGVASTQLYVGKALGSNDVVITAQSYFPSTSLISNFVSSSLPAGLSLASNSFNRWWLSGTPTTDSSASYTFTATNSNGVVSSNVLPITINPDVVTFLQTIVDPTPFIVSLPLASNAYRVFAAATSGTTITYTSSVDLTLYGLTLNSSTGYLTGTPTSNFGPTSVVFTATDSLGAFATHTNTAFTIARDTFTWPVYAPTFFQNKVMTPHQLSVSTASGRTIQSFTSTNMPPGLTLSPSGLVSGTFTGTTGGTFTVTATTGYQAPPTASNVYTYVAVADNLLIVQTNVVDPISNVFSNIQYQTVQYSSDLGVTPAYSIGNIYPLQYPSQPLLTISAGGMLSGTFTNVPVPFPRYSVDITAAYAGVTGTTTAVLTISNAPTPFTLAGWRPVDTVAGIDYSPLWSTSTYPFQVTADGVRSNVPQSWDTRRYSSGFPSTQSIYPDFGRNGTSFIAIDPSNVYEATYNTTTNTLGTFVSTLDGTGLLFPGTFGGVSSDSVSNWMIVVKSTRITSFVRAGNSGSWGTQWTDGNSNYTNASNQSSLQYIAPNYVYGQFGNSDLGFSNVLYSVNGKTWFTPGTSPIFSNIRRFAVSNTTIVAVGSARSTELGANAPISVSTNSGVTWTTQAVDLSNLIGQNVVINDIVYGNGRWVLCGIGSNSSNIIASSLNLSNWTLFPADNHLWTSIAVNGNGWMIGGTYSSNGASASNSPRSTVLSIDPAFSNSFVTSNSVFNYSTRSDITSVFTRMLSTPFSNTSSFTGTMTIPGGPLSFVEPAQTSYPLYQYVPYTIPIRATGASGFLYYYALGIPVGFQLVLDPTGTTATITGISPSNGSSAITLYAKTATSAAAVRQITFITTIPFFVNPQSGAGAYTALLRTEVDANAAQNARDNRTFPQVDSLAGPFMGPRAPDVITQTNCFLKLCKKPCPTCHTMM